MITFKRKKLTDDEFVEKIRKEIKTSRKMAYILGPLYVICIAVLLILLQKIIDSLKFGINEDSYRIGLKFGFGFGIVLAFILYKMVFYFVNLIIIGIGSRRDKLLVSYYDITHKYHEGENKNI